MNLRVNWIILKPSEAPERKEVCVVRVDVTWDPDDTILPHFSNSDVRTLPFVAVYPWRLQQRFSSPRGQRFTPKPHPPALRARLARAARSSGQGGGTSFFSLKSTQKPS